MAVDFPKLVRDWSAEKRIKKAKSCVRKLTDRVQNLLAIHAANEIIQYSDFLTTQIPNSHAANAFNSFQEAMFRQEVIQVLALWDSAADNAVSIPVVVVLIDNDDVIKKLQSEVFDAHANRGARLLNPSDDPDIAETINKILGDHAGEFAVEQAVSAERILKACINEVKEIQKREETTSIKNYRDHAAHSLDFTRREAKEKIRPSKYGEERELLDVTIRLIEDLYCWVNGTSFDISGECMDQARKCARDLWMNCTFNIGHKT